MKVVKKDSKKISKKKNKLNIIEKLTLNKKSSKIKKKDKTNNISSKHENLSENKEKIGKSIKKKCKSDLDKTGDAMPKADKSSSKSVTAKKQKNKIINCSSNWKILEQELMKDNKNIKKDTFKRKREFSNDFNGNNKVAKFDKEIWFDNVDVHDLMSAENEEPQTDIGKGKKKIPVKENAKTLIKTNSFGGLTKVVGMDCEMVGVGEGGKQSVLARVSLVNQFGKCVYDKYVKSREEVTDYRTFVSGIRPQDLVDAPNFELVQKEVADILQGRILVGHALWNDFKVLFLDHPKRCIRDTAKYIPFKTMTGGRSPALRVLSAKILGIQVQKGEHSSVQDAQAAMRLYIMHKKEWEAEKSTPKLGKKAKKNLNTAKVLGNSPLTAN